MKITRVVGTPGKEFAEPGYLIEKNILPDDLIVQSSSEPILFREKPMLRQKEWTLVPKELHRYSIEGKARVVTRKTVDGERTFVENARKVKIGDAYKAKVIFSIHNNERIMGLGQQEDGIDNYRGCRVPLYQNNMQIPMPIFVSSAGYAVLFDANCMMIYEEKDNEITMTLDAVSQIDYYVIEGEDFSEILKGIRRLTGKALLLPLWAYGYIQSKERYRTQQEILETAEEFLKRRIPISCLVLDWMTWEDGKWGNKRLDKQRFPNLKEMTGKLHSRGIAFMVSVWPNMNKGCEDQLEMLEAGKLYANLSTYDAFDEEAREIYWKQCQRELFAGGTDAWWCDSTEPFTPDWNGVEKKSHQERYQLARESLTNYLDARDASAYALWHAKGIHDNQRKSDPSRRVVNLTRSGSLSSQKYGTILWSGDISATWEVLRRQIVEGIHMCTSGIPYWTLDIGGFFAGNRKSWMRWSNSGEGTQPWFWHGSFEEGVKDKGFCELYVRWLQYGAFLPIMRSHGTDTPREPWRFEAPYYDAIVKYIRLRFRLVPYIYSCAYRIYRDDDTMMKSLVWAYPEDERAARCSLEYMFGDFLVCPVVHPQEYGPENTPLNGTGKMEVCLPEGDDWFDYENGEFYKGGGNITAAIPIDKMPLYIRAGSILPVQEESCSNLYCQAVIREITLEIYGGKDGEFIYYLDEGNGYGYQDGEKTEIGLSWKDKVSRLTISGALGSYPYPEKWKINCWKPNGERSSHTAVYAGEQITIDL